LKEAGTKLAKKFKKGSNHLLLMIRTFLIWTISIIYNWVYIMGGVLSKFIVLWSAESSHL